MSEALLEDVLTFSSRAVQFDRAGQHEVAAYYYREAAGFLDLAVRDATDEAGAETWRRRAQEYRDRAEALDELKRSPPPEASRGQKDLQQCHFLFDQALTADEAGLAEKAVKLYTKAIELGLSARKATSDPELQTKLANLARQALERAEQIKGIRPPAEKPAGPRPPPVSESRSPIPPARVIDSREARRQLHRGSSAHLKVTGQATYTEEEKRVLLQTSRINGIEYLPFMSVDLDEKFQYKLPFSDRDGLLALSPKQRRDFSRWARPADFCKEPVMVAGQFVDCFSIKQTVVSDCSFVASLAVSALYERRFGKRLVTSIIYPRNSRKEPIYNPFGKYMVKLHVNGVPRKVVIDDQLPLGRYGDLLCSYSSSRNELWVSLLEKAYMKVMGGYDFPGSNSNIDLHALTGWIPERAAIRPSEPDFNGDALFEKLRSRLEKGDVLATVATGEMSEAEGERVGLVPTHAYAVLDVRSAQGVRLLKLKNPWSHLRWRGNYSELDTKNWTPELQNLLHFDPNNAAMFDNGVFWIDYTSILRFFDVFYLNWNPRLFNYTFCIHQSWKAGAGPIKDAYNVGENPQFCLEVEEGAGAVWILLTRHITALEDFKENREYITVLVYRNDGKRVYYPNDPPPFIDGVRINSPHYLCKLVLSESSARRYTLVVSQYEKMHTIHYTLRAYATCPISLGKIPNPYEYSKQVSDGQWKGPTAGGCGNHPATHFNNPRYRLVLESARSQLLLDLRGPKQYQIGMDVICVVASDQNAPGRFSKKHSGAFRSGFVVMELEDVPAGTYDIIPSTFLPGQEGPFILTVKSSSSFQLSLVQ
ncbi:calpain-7-like [Bacillus rossius redtenbacheri]|uniref:calpain-7-like n=1 Tax=Bacillus rossius redtenbacheri TaxID=93214 RepID=UPI002FDD36AF